MKKVWQIFILELLMITIFATVHKANAETVVCNGNLRIEVSRDHGDTIILFSDGRVRRYDFSGRVEVISEKKLTANKLRARRNKVIYIEKITSRAINKNWGRIIRKVKSKWVDTPYMICYEHSNMRVHKGDKIRTYCVYSPYTRWIDDIDERYDIKVR